MKSFLFPLFLVPALSFAAAKSTSETATAKVNGHTLKITYSAPLVNNRAGQIFDAHGLISHDPGYPVWRAGANAATLFHTDVDLQFEGVTISKGDYSLFVDLKDAEHWMLIINRDTGQWGLKRNPARDLPEITMHMSKPKEMIEKLKYDLEADGNQGSIRLGWENHLAKVAFTIKN